MSNFLWWRDGVIYQIYPRSFYDSDGDGLGDLGGIIEKLPYLSELGIDAIWLSPIYPSPDKDFGYDVADYVDIDKRYGSLAIFDDLVAKAHRLGIRVVLDLVLNHSSNEHPWFKESKSSKDNPKRDFYIWREPRSALNREKAPWNRPNKWASIFGGSAWEFDETTREYYLHIFTKEQPDLNWRNPELRKAIFEVFRFWLDRGVDGFRLDVFNAFFKKEGLPNNPKKPGLRAFDRQIHINDIDQGEMLPLLGDLRALLDSYKERYAVGETFLATPEKAAMYCGKNLLHAAFNFQFTHGSWEASRFLKEASLWDSFMKGEAWPNYVMGNHDTPRVATRFGDEDDDAKCKLAMTMLLTLRGTPFIYYGDEIGMRDIRLKRRELLDPVGRRYWPFNKGRDGCRSPMQWNEGYNSGFSAGKPWLPLNPDFASRNVEAQAGDADSMLRLTKSLIKLRKEKPSLRAGAFEPIANLPISLMAYKRSEGSEILYIALNFAEAPGLFPLPEGSYKSLFRTSMPKTGQNDVFGGAVALGPMEGIILEAIKKA